MKKLIALSLALFSLNSFSNCPIEVPETTLCAKIHWTNGPVLNQNSAFELNFWQKEDELQTSVELDFEVVIYSWMIMQNGHSHGGPAMTTTKIGPSKFEVLDAKFFMGHMKGFWEVRFDLLKNDELISTGKSRVNL
jgi:hypothetical protein